MTPEPVPSLEVGDAVHDTVRDRFGRVMGHEGRISRSVRWPVAANGTPIRATSGSWLRTSCCAPWWPRRTPAAGRASDSAAVHRARSPADALLVIHALTQDDETCLGGPAGFLMRPRAGNRRA